MGIQGLLPFLKEIQREIHVSAFRGRKVAIDGYCWLHRGAYSCALQLVMKTEKLETLPFVRYCMKRVNMLLKYDITPVMVFDGGYLPLKAATEKDRRERRQANRQKGKEMLKEGKKSEAVDCFQKSVDVSPEMALALIKECRGAGVECIVAPYEADSQLAYLSKEGIVDLVITEDSDLLVFGCEKVLFKLDDSGNGKLIEIDQLGKANRGLVGFTVDSFRHMCILSGCDYLASVPGIGLGKALKLMKRFNKDPYRVIKALHYETTKVPKDYATDFRKADQTFLYQVVFDPRSQQQVRLNQLPSDLDNTDFEFAGVPSSPRKAVGIARGNINPLNHAVMDSYSPSKAPPPKSRSRASSVMGGDAGWGHSYPVNSQPPSSLLSSDSSRKHFKPPKKLKPKPATTEKVDAVKDEDLQTMYLNASMTEDHWHPSALATRATTAKHPHAAADKTENVTEKKAPKQVVMKSRFFSSLSSEAAATASEETPSDMDVAEKLRTRRRLALMPPEVDRLASSALRPCLGPSRNTVLESPDKPTCDEEVTVEQPLGRGRKRLSFPSKEQSVRSRLQEFGYSKSAAKRVKHSHPLSLLDQDVSPTSAAAEGCAGNPGVPQSPVKNPFAKVSTRQSLVTPPVPIGSTEDNTDARLSAEPLSSSCNPDLGERSQSLAILGAAPRGVAEETTVADISSTERFTQASTVTTGIEPRRHSFMTSSDYITTHPALQQTSTSTSSLPANSSSLLNHTTAHTHPSTSGQNNCLLAHPTFISQKRVSLGNSGKRRGVKGVSQSNVRSKFKAPKRSSDSGPGLKQLNLLSHVAQFAYSTHSRPQMTREQ